MKRILACLFLLLSVLLLADAPRALAENLPVATQRYAQACNKSGGGTTLNLDSGNSGVMYCTWNAHGRTECKVGSNQVNVCTIRCRSEVCYNANPDKSRPVWPLSGGPNKKYMPTDTLAPGQLAPVN